LASARYILLVLALVYQSKDTYEEVFRWFESCGLEDLQVIEQPIAVQGRRPLVGELLPALEASEVQQCAE
jgi:hypothetical protein